MTYQRTSDIERVAFYGGIIVGALSMVILFALLLLVSHYAAVLDAWKP